MIQTIFQVDAFAREIFQGNPAAVIPLAEWLPDKTMQAIAMENQLSETAFLRISSNGSGLRWFTPTIEVNLCGHATLATAHVLFEDLKTREEIVSFQTHSGILSVRRDIDGYAMDLPADPPIPVAGFEETIQKALGHRPDAVLQGRDDLVAILESEEQIRDLTPDFRQIAMLPFRGLIVSAPGKSFDFVSRCFFPQSGIDEDPVTGSAHATLAPYWVARLSRHKLRARQLSKRGGNVTCRFHEDRVTLIGNAVTYLRGEYFLPEAP